MLYFIVGFLPVWDHIGIDGIRVPTRTHFENENFWYRPAKKASRTFKLGFFVHNTSLAVFPGNKVLWLRVVTSFSGLNT